MEDLRLNLQGEGGSKWIWVDFKRSLAEAIIPSGGTQPSARLKKRRGASMQGGHHFHTCTTSTSQGVSYGETSPTLNGQLKWTVNGVGASENSKNLEQKRKHIGRTTIHET